MHGEEEMGGTHGHHGSDPALLGEGVEADDGALWMPEYGEEEPRVVGGQHQETQGNKHQVQVLLLHSFSLSRGP